MFIDYFKAFDSVNRRKLWKILRGIPFHIQKGVYREKYINVRNTEK